jgi:hypothetical protein
MGRVFGGEKLVIRLAPTVVCGRARPLRGGKQTSGAEGRMKIQI